jgi:predicted AAA+ superfamily ATPase
MRQRLLKEDVIEKAIYRDLAELYQIKKPAALEKLFLYLCEHSSELLNISNIATSLGLSREYTERYLEYLEAAHLVFRYAKYAKSVEEQVRSMEKCYVTDPGLLQLAFRPDAGKAVESMSARHLMAKKAFYWRDERHEVDLVLDEKEGVMPIEVKYQGNIGVSDAKGLVKFLTLFKEKSGIMVTKDLLEERSIQGMTIRHIPAWLFLLMADKSSAPSQSSVKK